MIHHSTDESDGGEAMPEYRCRRCGRLLFKGWAICLEIKCPKCHECQKVTKRVGVNRDVHSCWKDEIAVPGRK